MDEQLSFTDLASPTGLDIEAAALREHMEIRPSTEYGADVVELRRAVQLCSVGLGDVPVHPAGVEAPASLVVAALDLEEFVERRIHGWAGLN